MAPVKRKAAAEERPAKRNKGDDVSIKKDAAKFIKDNKPSSDKSSRPSKPSTRSADDDKEKKPVKSTLLQEEDRAFPRGGASVLTPLEHKQIKIQAERDVLFEQSGKKKPHTDGHVFSDDDEADAAAGADAAAPAKKKRKTKGKKNASADAALPKIKVQSLSYKNLVVGSKVLGQVTAITSKDVVLALPNNLTGFVPITAVSDKINEKIEALLAQAEEDEDEEAESDDDDDDIDLNSLFHIGQYLRATVTSTADESTSNGLRKNKKRLELSVDPKAANAGLGMADVVLHSTIQASVRSVEDHGLVMDLGLDDQDVKGFVSKKELGKAWGEIEKVSEGAVMLCAVTGKSDKVIKLAPDNARIGDINKQYLSDAPTVDAFLPGTAVEILVTENHRGGVAAKIMGMLDATADIVHSGAGARGLDDIAAKYKIGSKAKARVICTFPTSEEKKVGISFLDHIKALKVLSPSTEKKASQLQPSAIVEDAKVVHVEPSMGLFLKLTQTSNPAFAHISRISDDKIDTLEETTGKYKKDSSHQARILAFNPIDGVYNVSLEPKVINQPFLRIDDVKVGTLVKGTVIKLILGAKGVTGVLVSLADGIDALVPDMHMSDVKLQHPEKKFREGFPVTGRVLTVDLDKKQIRLTLKKTLVNSEANIWKDYHQIKVGAEAPGTIINIKPTGAVVQFYGTIRAWLPVSEMSEAYISDPSQHFRLGQTVNVHALSVDAEENELKVSCKDASAFGKDEESAWDAIKEGQTVNGAVTEVTGESVMLDLEPSGIKATLRLHHLADGSESKCRSSLKQIRVGQKLQDLVVLEKFVRRHVVILSNKPSLVKAAKAGTFISNIKDVRTGNEVSGFVRNITPDGIFVEFAAGLVGFMPKTQISLENLPLPAFGMRKDQSTSARVLSVDAQRFVLTQREEQKKEQTSRPATNEAVVNPVDGVSSSMADFTLGKETKARVVSVKETQLNVLLGDNLQGRIDVSECFSDISEIKNRKKPLQQFKPKQVLSVRVLGIHDARNHRFLPISHRHSKVPVFELTAKAEANLKSDADVLTLDKVQVGSVWTAFVNNIGDNHLWANISPNIRGRIDLLDLSDDVSLLSDIPKNFPVGSALKVSVKSVDTNTSRLDLAASTGASATKSLSDLSVGQILAGKVTKISERALTVQLSENLSGIVTLTEMSDDYTQANPAQHTRHEIVRVCVVAIDAPNKRVFLSMRPSRILSSSLPIEDKEITSIPQLAVNDVVRGFVKAVTDKGVVVNLGPRVDAFVRISDISDQYVKEWKSAVEIDQLVKGKILAVDASLNHVQMSLKASHVDKNYTPPNGFGDLKMGDIVTAKVRKVEDFGVFLDVDNTQPRVSGLCHRTQIADNKVEDVKKLYEPGDAVKAKVLHIDREKKRISFGLKASFFKNEDDSDEEMEDEEQSDAGVALDEDEEDSDEEMGGIDLENVRDAESDEESAEESSDDEESAPKKSISGGLATSGFDWSGSLGPNKDDAASDTEAESAPTKKRKRKAQIVEDRTGDLDANGPQSVADFERLLLTSPSDSALWIQYMAFQLQLSEVQKARDIGARALRTIHLREQDEKLNVWIALLNLEVAYGEQDKVDEVFKQACQVQDSYTIHERLASILTQAGKLDEADEIFTKMVGKKEFRASPKMWENYAAFLFNNRNEPARARALLARALQSIPARDHRALTAQFAALEFKSSNGDAERGRTVFEGLLSEWPKWSQGWDQFVDLERGLLKINDQRGDVKHVRALFERMAALKMKKRRARFVFKRWLEFEEDDVVGAKQSQAERVKALARDYVEKQQQKGGDDEDEDEE